MLRTRIASTLFWPCETRTSTCRNFGTSSSGLYRFLAIAVLLDVKGIPQVGPLQCGRIRERLHPKAQPRELSVDNLQLVFHWYFCMIVLWYLHSDFGIKCAFIGASNPSAVNSLCEPSGPQQRE